MTAVSMTITNYQLVKILRDRLGEEQAESLVSFVEEKVKEEVESKKDILASRQDLADAKIELVKSISDTKAELIKWMFIFWIGQMAAMFAFLKFFS